MPNHRMLAGTFGKGVGVITERRPFCSAPSLLLLVTHAAFQLEGVEC